MKKNKIYGHEELAGWMFILPVAIGTLIFSFVPLVHSFIVSFSEWDGVNPPKFVGFGNYIQLITSDRLFREAVRNTIVFTFASVPLGIFAGLFLALLVNAPVPLKNIFKIGYYVPSICSSIAVALVWQLIFSSSTGLLNMMLNNFGIPGPDWLGSSKWAMPAIVIVQVWGVAGYNMVVYLAGLQSVPESLYESSYLDGANPWQQFWRITLPMISPTTLFLAITSIIGSFQVFNLVFILTQGGPGWSTGVYIQYLYQSAFWYLRMGNASSMAWLLFLVLAGITLIQMKAQKYWVHYE